MTFKSDRLFNFLLTKTFLQFFPLITGAITIFVTYVLYKIFKAKELSPDDEEDEKEEKQPAPKV